MPLGSPFYIRREADDELEAALLRGDSIVLVKGPRQVGKTSLLARGLESARSAGSRVFLTDLQALTEDQLGSTDQLFRTVAEAMVEELELGFPASDLWNPERSWNVNLQRFLRSEALGPDLPPLVWALDEVDRLFTAVNAGEIFGLFRSWHNARALAPRGPWSRLTLAIAYATEAHLFISDLNQSPFNVGTRLALDDFTPDQVRDLNRRHAAVRGHPPLRSEEEVTAFRDLVGGHPYLVRRGLHELVSRGQGPAALAQSSLREDCPFGDHLRRQWLALCRDAEMCDAVRGLLRGVPPADDLFYRLRSAGIVSGETAETAAFRCGLYPRFLERRLG